MSTAKVVKVEVQKCSHCKGAGKFPDGTYSSWDCPDCDGTGKVNITYMDDNTIRAPLVQFLNHDSPAAQPGPKPKSGEILTKILAQVIDVSNDMTWFNFEDAAANERSKEIERQLWSLRGTLGDYVHALREEKAG